MSSPEYQKAYRTANKEKLKEKHKIWYEKNKDAVLLRQKEYRKNNPEKCKAIDKKKWEKHKAEYSAKTKERNAANRGKRALNRRMLRIEALKIIAEYHGVEVKCHVCGEKRLWILTVGHRNQDGKRDREKYGKSQQFYISIIKRIKTSEDLCIECMNCNACLSWYGKYPNDITEELFYSDKL